MPGDTKIDRFPAPGDFHAGRFQNFQEILKGGGGLLQGGVNSLPDLVLKGERFVSIAQPFPIMAAAGLGIFHNGKAMLQTQLIADPAQGPGGTPEVAEFLGTFQVYRAHDDVIMDMVLIYVRADDKSVVSLRQPHGKLLADLIGFFRRHFTRLKCLPEMVGNHVIRAPDSAGLVDILPLG